MSFTNKKLSAVYKDILHTDNSNTGIAGILKRITCGDGDTTSLELSDRGVRVSPSTDTTTTFSASDTDGNALVTVDSTNDLVKAGLGQHIVNTQFKSFGLWDFSPSAGEHHNLTTAPMITSASDDDFTGEVNGSAWGGTGTDPADSITIASAAKELVPSLWTVEQDITIDLIQYVMASDAASSINLHVMGYNIVTGSSGTAGDLSNGAVLADHASAITTGADRVSNGSITIQTANVDSGTAIVVFAESSDTDDMTVQLNIKYHLR